MSEAAATDEPVGREAYSPKSVGNRIKVMRLAFGDGGKSLSQAEFGRRIEVSAAAVGNWEQGISRPGEDSTEKIMDVFGVTSDYLIYGRMDKLTYELATRLLAAERSLISKSSDQPDS